MRKIHTPQSLMTSLTLTMQEEVESSKVERLFRRFEITSVLTVIM